MRTSAAIALMAAGLGLAACANTGATGTYQTELQRLNEDCRSRGGILVPTPGQENANPAANNFCQISGRNASRLSE
ncbi:hypothetical protein [Brevundimonas lenta]|uniref:Lipoprotein n=1 Tax=Brevundimonas lenta TaxID=424796 RepID=A0A7W6JFV2_9CAUL|nr:hypothetical protein [Brevundimonas lenta]MBB4084336.1 hypothetical protein [Brevundimonas lenta]